MLSPSEFRNLVNGRRTGMAASLLRAGLGLIEVPYATAVRWRNRRFDSGKRPIEPVDVPVVSVGNLTLGGTGKTPMVLWIARWFQRHGTSVTLISRGYGARAGSVNDEALELAARLPQVQHLQNPDRVAAARDAIERFGCQAIVLDDGFQHRRIARDIDLVMLDALEPFGFDRVFPRGTLREPVTGLARADVVVLSRADMLEPEERQAIRDRALSCAPKAVWAEVTHAPETLLAADGTEAGLDSLTARRVAAFSGVGNPAGFRHTLDTRGYRVVDFREFPDHYQYRDADIESLTRWAAGLDVEAVLCTHKDLVKLPVAHLGECPLWALAIGLEFLAGEDQLSRKLDQLVTTAGGIAAHANRGRG